MDSERGYYPCIRIINLISLLKSKTIKSKVTKFQHQKHYVFVIFFQLICIKQYVI